MLYAGCCCCCCLREWRSPRDSRCAQEECRRKKQIDGIGKKHDMGWSGLLCSGTGPPNNGFWFLGLVGGPSNRDGVRSGTKASPLDCPVCPTSHLPPVTHTSTIHDPRSTPPKQAPRSHGADRKYYMFGSARHPDKSNRRAPIQTRSRSGLVLHIPWSVLSPEEASRDTISLVALAPSHWDR